ncbi:MAG: thiamine pyrophosphokinase, partial [Paracoccus sp. (in: a-proteobacteria)]|nr:thiamine pyrophosphokinase [Paracoccus sp. (in: a-proteobacteria)]
LMPQAVIGDFDSISAETRAAIPSDRLHPVTEQDSTDFAKCLMRIDAPFVVAVGFGGRRLDHTLAAMNVLVRHPRPHCVILTAADAVALAPADLSLDLPPGTRFSLFPMGPVRGSSTGLRWPIDGLLLEPAGRVGTSNETTGPVRIRSEGPLLVILPAAHLSALLPRHA